jgi:hypothetical protein
VAQSMSPCSTMKAMRLTDWDMSTPAIGTKAARQPQYAQRRRKKRPTREGSQSASTAIVVPVTKIEGERIFANSAQIAAAYRRYVILIAT